MYLRDVKIRNYGIHQDTTVGLLPLTVFVGPNGGGKSAFFDALLNFSMLARGNLRQAFGPYPFSFRAALYRGASKIARIGYRVVISESQDDTENLSYEVDYAQNPYTEEQPSFTIFTERLVRESSGDVLFDRSNPASYPTFSSLELEPDRGVFSALRQRQTAPGSSPAIDPLVVSCAQQISRFNKFRLDPSVLCGPSRMPDLPVGEPTSATPATATPRLGHHGEDLAATLYYLSETKSPELERIKDRVKEIDGEFTGFEFNNLGTDRVAFAAVYSDARQIVPAVRLSAGMLTYLGLIVLVSTPNRPPVLMIEEPENGLTPQAIRAFYRAVKELAHAEEPERRSQVLLSSHSPFVICEAWNGEDRDFIHQVKVVDGKAVVRRFSEVIAEHHIQLAKDAEGRRTHLSLANAEQIMSGYLS